MSFLHYDKPNNSHNKGDEEMARQLKGKARKQTKQEKRLAAEKRLKAKEDFVKYYLPTIAATLLLLFILFYYFY